MTTTLVAAPSTFSVTSRAIVRLGNVSANLRTARQHLPPAARIYAVVKADAYGHGMAEVATSLAAAGVDAFAVSSASEGAELREAGIRQQILVLGPLLRDDARTLISNDLTVTLNSAEMLEALQAESALQRRRALVHVRVDLGCAGQGMPVEAATAVVRTVAASGSVVLDGVYAHGFAAYRADYPGVLDEVAAFDAWVQELGRMLGRRPFAHVLSSPGLAVPGARVHDAVRLGSLLYGIRMTPGGPDGLRPALEIRSIVSEIKIIPPGTRLAYEAGLTADRTIKVAVVAAGFAHAPFLSADRNAQVLIRGRRVPVAGRAFMTSMLVDVTSLPDVAPGDEVVVLGADGDNSITAEEIAARSGVRPSAVPFLGPAIKRFHVD
ncbi:alanine racemase [Arenibaculum pallidiluteum]|uniref:alanine racemase n=1 Tax=Arenibaculum pallidiluteum TaxID=2812559 RepID=UPI001A960B79|nr:alanine racemase [Arenibaculum pallidiluteum]